MQRWLKLCSIYFASGIALVVLAGFLLRDEQLASFKVGPHLKINVYAEGAFHYEPPGSLYFELTQWGAIRVPKRRFMGVGPERKPTQSFRLVTADNDGILALVLDDEVQMIHEIASGYTWPGEYTNVTDAQWHIAEALLQRLHAAHPDVRCPRQIWYRDQLDRLKVKTRLTNGSTQRVPRLGLGKTDRQHSRYTRVNLMR